MALNYDLHHYVKINHDIKRKSYFLFNKYHVSAGAEYGVVYSAGLFPLCLAS